MFDPSAPHTNSMSYIKFAVARPWPKRPTAVGSVRPVRYCFANEEAKDELLCPLMAGFDAWAHAIKFPISKENGHNLCWKSVMARRTDGKGGYYAPFCYLDDYRNVKNPGTWNPLVLDDVLAIHLVEGSPSATVGWVDEAEKGRHKLLLPKGVDTKKVVHEIGHVLGMLHEHARFDRDDFVTYKCKAVKGYNTALISAIVAGFSAPDASARLCYDKAFALRFDFIGAQYTKNDFYYHEDRGIFDVEKFDYGSIMMYPTSANAEDDKCWTESRLDLCPLVGGKEGNTWPMMPALVPSSGDVDFVKKYYSWEESASNDATSAVAVALVDSVVERKVKRDPQPTVRVHHIFS
ncbi:hypothetical protein PTNB73_06713 [Pyrenophora teres f. teres]|nr:hypothetical protein HRS9122_09139 [Pyrenophora teres f. teres]KAE8857147.1 hypothetical protein PTNB29_08214 [Pyrenophora teres f. teres]KAE8863506.1 hypothetical protein PTNB73_06713 [Pyrenophora teres f. teres]